MQFVLIQFLRVRSFGNTGPLRWDRSAFCIQGKMHAVKSTEHRNGIVAPQSAVTPNDLLRHSYDPAGHMGISTVDKLPSTPVFVSSARTRLIRIVIWTATELVFVAIVRFAGEKRSAVQVLS